jgi:hypothetical protein
MRTIANILDFFVLTIGILIIPVLGCLLLLYAFTTAMPPTTVVKSPEEKPIFMFHDETINKDVVVFIAGEDIIIQGYDDPKCRVITIKNASTVAVKEKRK